MASSQPLTFAEMLRRFRIAAGLTQEQLAERAGVSVRGISDLERGVNRAPRQYTFERLAEALHLTPAQRRWMQAACAPNQASAPSPGQAAGVARAPLVGRERELIQLDRHLSGEGTALLLLAGEPGIGKSRLLEEGARRAAEHGWTVLAGGCHRRSGEEPYAPFVGAFTRWLATRSPAQQRLDLRGCSWLVRLLPELAERATVPAPSWTLPPEQERRLMFAAVARFLANAASSAGTLLVLDDLHWAGADTLDLLASVLREGSSADGIRSLRIVGAYRDTELGPREALSLLLTDLRREGLAAWTTLTSLDRTASRMLLTELLAEEQASQPALVDTLLDRAGGLPLFLVSCAQEVRAGVLGDDEVASAVPTSAAESIHARVAVLPELARDLLGIAAVVGRRVPTRLLLRVGAQLGYPRRDLPSAVTALCEARLLEEDGAGAYRFLHDLIHEAVVASLGEAQRMTLHEEVATALEGAGEPAPAELLAYHYAQAGDAQRAVVYLERAGDHARAVLASAEAEGYYRQLVARLEELGRPVEAGRARVALGALLLNLERFEQAIAALDAALQNLARVGDLDGMASAAAHLADVYSTLGAPTAGLDRVLPIYERLRDAPPSRGKALLCRGLAALYYGQSRTAEWLEWDDRLAEQARAIGDDSLLAEALSGRGGYLMRRGHGPAALPLIEEAVTLAERSGDLQTLIYALHRGSIYCQSCGDLVRDREWVTRAHASAERLGKATPRAHTFSRSGTHWFLAGDWNRAREDFLQQLALAERLGKTWLTSYAYLDLGRVYLVTGRVAAGIELLERGIAQGESASDPQAPRGAHPPLAEHELLCGRPEAARDRLRPLLDTTDDRTTLVTEFLPLLAWAYLDLGDGNACMGTLAECEARAAAGGMRPTLVNVLRVRALGGMRHEQWDVAAEALRQALDLSREIGYPYLEAKVLYTWGQLHAAQGESQPARDHLQQALAICGRLGERPYAEQIERALADIPLV